MKKKYEKPTLKVYKLRSRVSLMVGSPTPDQWGHIPGHPADDKHLA
ncbi:MAG: hypothetical protein IKR31_01730 [Prevotella sp.]|nr:hypothetical protein [Prevotella sp.]